MYNKYLKRIIDITFASVGLVITCPFILVSLILIFLSDRKNPIYFAPRVGIGGKRFIMYKIRTMVINADINKVDTTSINDPRITPIGHLIRRFKLDELLQLVNVVIGDMSLVGPRPNVEREIAIYTELEKELLTVRPGVTDFSSIIFSDLANIMKSHEDPNIAYNQLVRPWKSRFGLYYIKNKNFKTDILILFCTILLLFSRNKALKVVNRILRKQNANPELVRISLRNERLQPYPPPGGERVVTSR